MYSNPSFGYERSKFYSIFQFAVDFISDLKLKGRIYLGITHTLLNCSRVSVVQGFSHHVKKAGSSHKSRSHSRQWRWTPQVWWLPPALPYPVLTTRRQETVEKRSELTSRFTQVIEISSDEERCFPLLAPGQSVCKVLTISSESVLPF